MKFEKLKIIIRVIIFIIIFISIFCVISEVFRRKSGYREMIGGFKNLEENSVDVICLGSSHMYCTINPLIIWEKSKINSYVLATQQQSIEMSYFYLKEALKTQKPKVVILETYMIGKQDSAAAEGVVRDATENLPWALNKLQLIYETAPKDSIGEYYIDFIKYHSRWKELHSEDFQLKNDKIHPLRGYHFYSEQTVVCLPELEQIDDKNEIEGEDLEYLEKMVKLTKENDIDLILLYAPYEYTDQTIKDINAVEKFAQENEILFINCIDKIEEIGINEKEDFYDTGHLNYRGSTKVSTYVAEILKSKYNIQTEYMDKTVDELDRELSYYYRTVKNSVNK